ncbi:MAG: hypothetical protein ACRCTZ_22565 [Sarcina sp.]
MNGIDIYDESVKFFNKINKSILNEKCRNVIYDLAYRELDINTKNKLKEYNINVLTENGDLKSLTDILVELHNKLDNA